MRGKRWITPADAVHIGVEHARVIRSIGGRARKCEKSKRDCVWKVGRQAAVPREHAHTLLVGVRVQRYAAGVTREGVRAVACRDQMAIRSGSYIDRLDVRSTSYKRCNVERRVRFREELQPSGVEDHLRRDEVFQNGVHAGFLDALKVNHLTVHL